LAHIHGLPPVVLRSCNKLVVNLAPDAVLTGNRQAAVDMINRVTRQHLAYHPIGFDVDLGLLKDPASRAQLLEECGSIYVPPHVTLGHNVLGLVLEDGGQIVF